MSDLEGLTHPFANLTPAPTAQEVTETMDAVKGFDEVIYGIEQTLIDYKDLKKQEMELPTMDMFNEITVVTGIESAEVAEERDTINTKLRIIDKEASRLLSDYLKIFVNEYLRYLPNGLRMWSFPDLVWQHYAQMLCRLTGQYPDSDIDENFKDDKPAQYNRLEVWVRERTDIFPPSLQVHSTVPKYYSSGDSKESEMHMHDGHERIVQIIYSVRCGPRLCGTRQGVGNKVVCDHPDHIHHFTKRPKEWVSSTVFNLPVGWLTGNPYGIHHDEPDREVWQPYFTPDFWTGEMSPNPACGERYREFYDDKELDDGRTQQWLLKIPEEASLGSPNSSTPQPSAEA